ncbi:hypothetical protein LCGC14_1650060 [marine sediment metagenome]|uniref:MobA-like NTP transferase domain-containing protein n=1 Tax=marine sediment metagenome TaxID=412755 RepID=A0A0F9HX08_9ZZZZ
MKVGRHSYTGNDQYINGPTVEIGNFTAIAGVVKFHGTSNHTKDRVSIYPFHLFCPGVPDISCSKGGIYIGNDVWIGEGVTLLSGVTIGDGVVIGARAVISKDCEPYGVYVGNPAKLVKHRFPANIIRELKLIKWWDWSDELIVERIDDFYGTIEDFVEKYRCPMNYVIMAAGEEKRWGNHLGVPKQLIDINGERLIDRTIRQLKERGAEPMFVTVPEIGHFGEIDAEQIKGTERQYELGKFINVDGKLPLPITFFWGDTYFTDEAMNTILADENEFRFFGRETPGEIFALKANELVMKNARTLFEIRKSMTSCGSWDLYRLIVGLKFDVHLASEYFTEINDLTEDFDKPDDYTEWRKKYDNS